VFTPGNEVGGYRLQKVLGEGPFGVVWRAQDRGGQTVAVKLLRSAFSTRPEGRAAFSRLKTASKAHRKAQHPYLASVLGLVDDGPGLGIVSALNDGFSIDQLQVSPAALRGEDPGELSRLLFLFEELGDVLHWLHERHVVHGNLKPSNVLVQRGDFGLVPHVLDLSWSAIGIAAARDNAFISPEQFAGRVPTAASDQWAFGMLLSMAVGAHPGPQAANAPELLVEALRRMRAQQAQARFPNMKAVVAHLRSTRSQVERVRVLSRARRRVQQAGTEPPVPTARVLHGPGGGGPLAADLVAPSREREVSPLKLAPAALSRDLQPETPVRVEPPEELRPSPRTPWWGVAAVIVAAIGLWVLYVRGGAVPAPASAESPTAAPRAEDQGPSAAEPSGPSQRPSSAVDDGEAAPTPGEEAEDSEAAAPSEEPALPTSPERQAPDPEATSAPAPSRRRGRSAAPGPEPVPRKPATLAKASPSPAAARVKASPSPSAAGPQVSPGPSSAGPKLSPSPSSAGPKVSPSPSAAGAKVSPSPSSAGAMVSPSPSSAGPQVPSKQPARSRSSRPLALASPSPTSPPRPGAGSSSGAGALAAVQAGTTGTASAAAAVLTPPGQTPPARPGGPRLPEATRGTDPILEGLDDARDGPGCADGSTDCVETATAGEPSLVR
jgi:serine/threonine protein kinase